MRRRLGRLAVGMLLATGAAVLALVAQENDSAAITGAVSSGSGPEAGVWVIAETGDLPTKFRKIVVTGDDGRFLLPELPEASYSVWVRGYGLVDSTPVTAVPGQDLRLTAVAAQTPQEAAAVYPAAYWLSLIEVPEAGEFPGTGPEGNGISEELRTRDEYLYNVKACLRCHQVGGEFTRGHPDGLDHDSAADAWDARVRMGQRGAEMSMWMSRFGRERGLR
ncbi:MAG: carboxypeptidase-like regulatory domain-containing protein, partial [Acidobacteria bacterium]|nr:carboxypeptidase-like regulatory domain-containing protein [Acidobacteriota bacterium]